MLNRFAAEFVSKAFFVLSALTLCAVPSRTQSVQRARFDVVNYRIEANLQPSANRLQTVADVTFTPLEDTRSITFELNGSLKVESVSRVGAATIPQTGKVNIPTEKSQVTFVQDQAGTSSLGPTVRVEFPNSLRTGETVTLRFQYGGTLLTPEGGPLASKKLASVGKVSYLMYAGRWFPFHDYAADLATSDVTVSVPNGQTVVGFSENGVSQTSAGGQTKFRFVQSKPSLVNNFAAGSFVSRNLKFGAADVTFYTQSSNERLTTDYGETIGRALEAYTQRYGAANNNGKMNVVQIDDESLDLYSGVGIMFVSNRFFESVQLASERLQRETAYQWWGLTVGLKSFDDAWLSQGLAEYSAIALRETNSSSTAQQENLNREVLEKSLAFEQTASLLRAPSTLDDQSAAYQYIMFGKGAMVFRLLRETLRADKFNQLLRTFLEQYRSKNASIDDFEKLTTRVADADMRYFFARWVESTGVPEYTADYQIIRRRDGKFVTRGTVKQNYEGLRLPVEIRLRSEGEKGIQTQTIFIEDASEDFSFDSAGTPLEVIVDPNYRTLRISDELRVSSIARRGIEQAQEGNYAEAQQQFEAALKLDRNNSWVYYQLGLIFLEQRNYDLALENFRAALNGNLRPSWIEVWANIKAGNAYDAKGDRTRAVAFYKKAQETAIDYNDSLKAAADFLSNKYDPKTQTSESRQ